MTTLLKFEHLLLHSTEPKVLEEGEVQAMKWTAPDTEGVVKFLVSCQTIYAILCCRFACSALRCCALLRSALLCSALVVLHM